MFVIDTSYDCIFYILFIFFSSWNAFRQSLNDVLTIIICAFKVNFQLAMINGLFPGSKLESPRDMTNGQSNICPVFPSPPPYHPQPCICEKQPFSVSLCTAAPSLMVSRFVWPKISGQSNKHFLKFIVVFQTWNILIDKSENCFIYRFVVLIYVKNIKKNLKRKHDYWFTFEIIWGFRRILMLSIPYNLCNL